jgi:hypothetical protein
LFGFTFVKNEENDDKIMWVYVGFGVFVGGMCISADDDGEHDGSGCG